MSNLAVNTITNATGGSTATINGMTPTAQSLQGFRNRIINGNMVIDQRNAGASVTPTADTYTLDRWAVSVSASSIFSIQRSSVAPTSFINSALITSLSAYSVPSAGYFLLNQAVEGFNVADLGWGTASAQAITVSFWVRSSLTGTFGGALNNSGSSRSYPFSYTINAANTWEQKTLTIAGDTTGTWLTDNRAGVFLRFGLGVGSTFSGTAGTWSGSALFSATGATSVVGTNGATFYITGVQLEAGSVATPFERRDYGRELMLCQRYYAVGSFYWAGGSGSGVTIGSWSSFPVTMRATPTMSLTPFSYTNASGSAASNTTTAGTGLAATASGAASIININWTASIEL